MTIGATSRFDLERFAGEWKIRERFVTQKDWFRFSIRPTSGEDFIWHETSVYYSDTPDILDLEYAGKLVGPGRLQLGGAGAEFWVLWVDEGFRTAAIGTPHGRFGFIVDRNTTGGADRIAAAREILDFNGYDVTALKVMN